MGNKISKLSGKGLEFARKKAKDSGLPINIYEDFAVYANCMVPSWGRDKLKWEWFHYEITDHFQLLLDGELDYLSIETHSQLGKSVLVALFITYIFGLNPDKNIMYFTYNETSSTKFTKDYIFGFMGSDKYKLIFPTVILKNDLDKSDHTSKLSMEKKRSTLKDNEFNIIDPLFQIQYQGKYVAFGLGQGSHGRPADIMIVDDYVAKAEDIKSEMFRDKMETSFNSDIILRFQANTIFMIICTRWYENDPIGILMNKLPQLVEGFMKEGLKPPIYKSIKIRAEYRTSDINSARDPRTKDGEWLWLPMLSKYLLAKGGKYYQALFNCDPSESENVKQITKDDFGYYYVEDLPKFGGRTIIIMDGASTVKSRSDHTAIGRYIVYGKKRYLIKLWYFKKTIPQLQRFMEDLLNDECKGYDECIIEHANSGVAVFQYLQEKGIRCKAIGFNGKIIDDNKKTITSKKDITSKTNSKMDRYIRHMSEYSHNEKRIFIPYYTVEHQEEFLKQLITFTGDDGKRDDFVDMHTYLVNYTSQNIIISTNHKYNNNLTNNKNMCYNLRNANYFMKR